MRISHPSIKAALLTLVLLEGKQARAEEDLSFSLDMLDWEDDEDERYQRQRHRHLALSSAVQVDMGSPFKLENVLMFKGSSPWRAENYDSATQGPLTIVPCLWYDNPCGSNLCVSFTFPGPAGGQPLYLRHSGWKMLLTPYGSSGWGGMEALMKDGSFCLKPGFADSHKTFSIQVANNMHHYLHQRADGSFWAEWTGYSGWSDDGASFFYQLPKTPVDVGLYLGSSFTIQSVLQAQGGAAPLNIRNYDLATNGPLTITKCLWDQAPCGQAPCVALMLPDPTGGQPFYLRHSNYQMQLDQYGVDSGPFALDSSFCLRPGFVNGHGTLSLQSTNMLGNYLNHRTDGSFTAEWTGYHEFSYQGASFHYDHPTVPQEVQMESILNRLGGPSWKAEGTDSSQPLVFKPCLDFSSAACGNDRCVSLMINGQQGSKKYLRHGGFKLRLTQYGETSSGGPAALKADGSFCLRPGHAQAKSFSLEATNFPGHFINVRRDGSLWIDVLNNVDYSKESASFYFKNAPEMCNTYNPCESGLTCSDLNGGVCYPTSSLPTPAVVPIQAGTPIGHELQLAMEDEPPIGPFVMRNCPLSSNPCGSSACISLASSGRVDTLLRASPDDSHIRVQEAVLSSNDLTTKQESSFCLRGGDMESVGITLESVQWTDHVLTIDDTTKVLKLQNRTNVMADRTTFSMRHAAAPMCSHDGSHYHCASGYFCHHKQPAQSLCYPKRPQGATCRMDKECLGSLTCNLELVGYLWKGSFAKLCGPAEGSTS